MTWLHCSIKDGSVVAVSPDDKIEPRGEGLRKNYFQIHVDEPVEDLEYLTERVYDGDRVVHKFRGVVDIDKIFPDATEAAKVRNREVEMPKVATTKRRNDIKERLVDGRSVPSVKPIR